MKNDLKDNDKEKKKSFFIIFNNWGSIGFLAFLYSKTFRSIIIFYLLIASIELVNMMLNNMFHNSTINLILNVLTICAVFISVRMIRKGIKNKKNNAEKNV